MRRNPFPLRIFVQFFILQVLAALVAVSSWFIFQFFNWPNGAYGLWVILLIFLTSYLFTQPLRQIIRRAMRISSKKWAQIDRPQDEDLLEEEPGEYALLSSVLEKIDRKLQKKRQQLAVEKEQTRAFMAAVQEGFVRIDTSDRILFFNSQFGAQFLDSEMLQKTEMHLTEVLRVPEVLDCYRTALLKGKSAKVRLWMNTRFENQQRFFSVSMNPIRNEATNEIIAVIGIFYDMTDLKMAEQIRVDFVANASHELRTPLTSIKGFLQTAIDELAEGNPDSAQKCLQTVSKQVQNMNELVLDLLTLSKLEHQPELKLERVHSLAVTTEIIDELGQLANSKNQKLMITGENPFIVVDRTKLEIVLRNLISNSLKYSPENAVVKVRWTSVGGAVELVVEDNGPGIAEEHQSRLFERFYRVDRGRNRDVGGTGLGLAIVKHILQVHGGTIDVQSEPGLGSKFICKFPGAESSLR